MESFDIFNILNLDYPGLEMVKESVKKEELEKALSLLKAYFINSKKEKLFIHEEEKSQLVKQAKKYHKEEINEILKVAEEVADNTFLFKFRWDMERTNIPVKFKGEINWKLVPFDDPEWTWMLNRHRYWIALGQAYALTGNEKYAQVFFKQLEHWIDNNPIEESDKFYTWRTIEAGIRCENWLKAFDYLKKSNCLTDKIFAKLIISLKQHCDYIYKSYSLFSKKSNWGVLENHGLFQVSLYLPEIKDSKLYLEASNERLKKAAKLQVMKDGVHWEQSPMYHNEVLHCFMDSIIFAENNNYELYEDIKNVAKKMVYADLYYVKPNHKQPMKGDSDNTDIRDKLTTAAIIFKDRCLKFMGYKNIDFENLFIFGTAGEKIYNELSSVTPEFTSYAFKDSGNYVMRSGWEEDDLYLNFHCGILGGGHDHGDTFNVDIHAFGKDIISDSGRYTYVEGEERKYFKQCSSHNTTLVDSTNFTKFSGSWGIEQGVEVFGQNWISQEGFDYVQGGHKGYINLPDPVLAYRKVLFVKGDPKYWVLLDSFETKGEHNYSQYFHFMPGKISFKQEDKSYSAESIEIIPLANKELKGSLLDSYISFEYNTKEANKTMEYSLKAQGFTSILTLLLPRKSDEYESPMVERVDVYDWGRNLVDNTVAEAVRLVFKEEEHIILFAHRASEEKTYFYIVDGTEVNGKVVLIKRSKLGEEIINIC